MHIAARLDEMGKGAWIATMIVAFVVFWPVGLAILAYMIWSGRMGCRSFYWDESMKEDFQKRREEMREEWRARREEWKDMKRAMRHEMKARWHSHHPHPHHPGFGSSGNAAFDDYRAETLKRLEEEQAEFSDFLTNLRKARDKAEFDQFMQNRKSAPAAEPETEADHAPDQTSNVENRDNPGSYSV